MLLRNWNVCFWPKTAIQRQAHGHYLHQDMARVAPTWPQLSICFRKSSPGPRDRPLAENWSSMLFSWLFANDGLGSLRSWHAVWKQRVAPLLSCQQPRAEHEPKKANCWDNAVAESFLSTLKKERIKKHIYKNRELAIADLADYIGVFYNQTSRPSHLDGVSPEQFAAADKVRPQGVH